MFGFGSCWLMIINVGYWLVFIFSYWPVIDGMSIGCVNTLIDRVKSLF